MVNIPSRQGDRVARHTDESVQRRIELAMRRRVNDLAGDEQALRRRLGELDREWDIERKLETNASLLALVGVVLGLGVNRWFLLLPLTVTAFLFQHAVQGWCPPLPIFRRLGTRTQREIGQERYALKAIRGDFQGLGDDPRQRREQVWSALER
jgi:hypothetical protein